MKNWKSNLFVIVLAVFMLVCGFMLGRMNLETDTSDVNQSLTDDDNVVDNDNASTNDEVIDNKINSSEEFISLFVGKYGFVGHYSDENVDLVLPSDCGHMFINLELKQDGTFDYSYGINCGGGGGGKGKYAIARDKIYLYNEDCKYVAQDNVCVEPNCNTLIEFDYKLINGQIKIYEGIKELIKE